MSSQIAEIRVLEFEYRQSQVSRVTHGRRYNRLRSASRATIDVKFQISEGINRAKRKATVEYPMEVKFWAKINFAVVSKWSLLSLRDASPGRRSKACTNYKHEIAATNL